MDFTLLYCSSMVASSASTACWMICRAPCWISSSSTLFVSDLLPVACSVSIFMVVGAGSRRFAGCAFDKQHSQLNRHRLLKFPLRPLYTRFDNSSASQLGERFASLEVSVTLRCEHLARRLAR